MHKLRIKLCRDMVREALEKKDDVALRNNCQNLMNIGASLQEKCEILKINDILLSNCDQSDLLVRNVIRCFHVLIQYSQNLIKPPELRPGPWRAVKFAPLYRERVAPVKGSELILHLLGYTVPINNGLAFPSGAEPNADQVIKILVDLLICKTELSAYQKGQHADPLFVEKYLGANSRISQSSEENETNGSFEYIQLSSSMSESNYQALDTSDELRSLQRPLPAVECDLQPISVPSTVESFKPPMPLPKPAWHKADSSPQKLGNGGRSPMAAYAFRNSYGFCTDCSSNSNEKYCENCDTKRCRECDDTYHMYPSRKGHNRLTLAQTETAETRVVNPKKWSVPSSLEALHRPYLPQSLLNSVSSQTPTFVDFPQVQHIALVQNVRLRGLQILNLEQFYSYLAGLAMQIIYNKSEFIRLEELVDNLIESTDEFEERPDYQLYTKSRDKIQKLLKTDFETLWLGRNRLLSTVLNESSTESIIDQDTRKKEFLKLKKNPYFKGFISGIPHKLTSVECGKSFITTSETQIKVLEEYLETKNHAENENCSKCRHWKNILGEEFMDVKSFVEDKKNQDTDSDEEFVDAVDIDPTQASGKQNLLDEIDTLKITPSSPKAAWEEKKDSKVVPDLEKDMPSSSTSTPNRLEVKKPVSVPIADDYYSDNVNLSDSAKNSLEIRKSLPINIVPDSVIIDPKPNAPVPDFPSARALPSTTLVNAEPEMKWVCSHCTFHNSRTMRVCELCDKTSDNPVLVTVTPPSSPLSKTPEPIPAAGPTEPMETDGNTEGLSEAAATGGSDEASGAAASPKPHENLNLNQSYFIGDIDKEKKMAKEKDVEIIEMRRKAEFQEDGLKLLKLIKEVEADGRWTNKHFEIAYKMDENGNPLKWLNDKWEESLDYIRAVCTSMGSSRNPNMIGYISKKEAEIALLETLNIESAVQYCIEIREESVKVLMDLFGKPADYITHKMLKSDGNIDDAIMAINAETMGPLIAMLNEGASHPPVIEDPIFITFVQSPEIDKERRIRSLISEGSLKNWEQASNLIDMIDGNMIPDSDEIRFVDVIEAVQNCTDISASLDYLQHECATCLCFFPAGQIANLFMCQCRNCKYCLVQHFHTVIRDRHVVDMSCPSCDLPPIDDSEQTERHFQFLDMLLKNLLNAEDYTLYIDKLKDWYLMQEENFRWCAHCNCGFIYQGVNLKMLCHSCKQHTCFGCLKPWEAQHDNISCEEFRKWKEENDPEYQAVGLAKYLQENGIDCPRCKYRYALAKGGCMHFTCSRCRHEFCSGCGNPFLRKETCPKNTQFCRGLHCHHPRDCLFYLRDNDVPELQSLLVNCNIQFNKVAGQNVDKCQVIEQRDSGDDLPCGRDVPNDHAGLCEIHYKEYLVGLINKSNIDPIPILDTKTLELILQRKNENVPPINQNETDANYKARLRQHISDVIPLQPR